jgi:hypothetical protein
MAPEHKLAVIILTNRSGSSLPKTAAAALELVLPLQPRADEPRTKLPPLTEQEMQALVGTYTNHRQTVELSMRDGKLHARRRGTEGQGTSGAVTRTGENRIAITGSGDDPATGRPLASFFVVKNQNGQPEYLLAGSRALKRQP